MLCERLALLIFAGTLALSLQHSQKTVAGPEIPPAVDSSISVQLAPERQVWKVGERVKIEVKVVNRGTRPVFVGRDLQAPGNGMCHLSLGVVELSGHALSTGVAWAVDSLPDSKESFASFLARNWIALDPGYFYGTTIETDASEFPLLGKPGQYQICGVFESKGLTAPSYFNVLAKYPDEVKQLPYDAWTGEVKTNCVEVSIISATEPGNDHKLGPEANWSARQAVGAIESTCQWPRF